MREEHTSGTRTGPWGKQVHNFVLDQLVFLCVGLPPAVRSYLDKFRQNICIKANVKI